jgi:hypothetical protein
LSAGERWEVSCCFVGKILGEKEERKHRKRGEGNSLYTRDEDFHNSIPLPVSFSLKKNRKNKQEIILS